MQRDDETLVRLTQQNDTDAFGELYERYYSRIYSYISLRVGSGPEAEDLAEGVFLRALEKIHSFEWRGQPFITWLFRIARNLVIDHLRAHHRRVTSPLEDMSGLASTNLGPLEILEKKLTRDDLIWAISQLTEAQRQVIALKFAGGLSNAEAARVLNKSEGAVKALQHSGIDALRRIFQRNQLALG